MAWIKGESIHFFTKNACVQRNISPFGLWKLSVHALTLQVNEEQSSSIYRSFTKGNIAMKTSFIQKGLAAAALVVGSVAANAAVIDLGVITTLTPKSFSEYVGIGAFGNTYMFSLPANGGSGYDLSNTPVTIAPIPVVLPLGGTLNMAFTAISVYSAGADNAIGGSGANADTLLADLYNAAGQNSYSVALGPNAGGTFFMNVVGFANGSLGGQYSGAISVTAVPEPESYAMLLAGLGVMGAIAVRRNKRKAD